MDKSAGKDWFAKTINNVTEETAKVYRISRLKLELATLSKSKHEKQSVIARKLLQYIAEGKIDLSLFEPEYSAIKNVDKKIDEINKEIIEIKANLKIGFGKHDDGDIIKVVDSKRVDMPENENTCDDLKK